MDLEDRRRIDRCLSGDASAWKELVDLGCGPVRAGAAAGLARAGVVPGEAEVEEVAQQTMASLTLDGGRRLRSFRGRCRLTTWLSVLAFRAGLNHVRSRRRSDLRARQSPLPPQPTAGVSRGELDELLLGLSPLQRAALRLHFLEGMSRTEIAEILGLSPNSISSLIVRALTRVRGRFVHHP